MYCLTFTCIPCKLIVNNYSAINVYTAAAHAAHAAAGSSGVSIMNGGSLWEKNGSMRGRSPPTKKNHKDIKNRVNILDLVSNIRTIAPKARKFLGNKAPKIFSPTDFIVFFTIIGRKFRTISPRNIFFSEIYYR